MRHSAVLNVAQLLTSSGTAVRADCVRPLLLQLPWPISSGANEPDGLPLGCYSGGQGLESVQLRRKSGQVWLKLRKAEGW
ncbi:hypothetical protein HaLaN_08709, partial [Haematococcus lacustris]